MWKIVWQYAPSRIGLLIAQQANSTNLTETTTTHSVDVELSGGIESSGQTFFCLPTYFDGSVATRDPHIGLASVNGHGIVLFLMTENLYPSQEESHV
jgi:hypothetical protein